MATNVKNAIFRKKIGGIVYDLMAKTTAAMVYVDDTTTLLTKLTALQATVDDSAEKLAELIGEEGAGSIAEQIQTAIEELRDSIVNEETPDTIGYRVKAVETAITAINDGSTGILVTAKNYTDAQIAARLGATYKAAGSVAFEALPTLEATIEGNVYNISNGFTTTEDFIEGAGKSFPAGTNVACIKVGEEYKWDVLTGMTDLSAYDTAEVAAGKVGIAKQEAIDAAAQDATSKANAAQTAAEQTAQAALDTYKGEVTTALAGKGRFIVSDTEPEDLTELDLWAYIVPDAAP